MAMNGNNWGTAVETAVRAAVVSAGIAPGTEITQAQLIQVWQAVKTADVTHITGNAVTSTANVANGALTRTGTIA